MAEGARLESVYTATYREFESLTHRHILEERRLRTSFFYAYYTSKSISYRPITSKDVLVGSPFWGMTKCMF